MNDEPESLSILYIYDGYLIEYAATKSARNRGCITSLCSSSFLFAVVAFVIS